MKMAVQIGDTVRIQLPRESIINGREYVVGDVIRSVFDRTDVLCVCVVINGGECPMNPEDCTVIATAAPAAV